MVTKIPWRYGIEVNENIYGDARRMYIERGDLPRRKKRYDPRPDTQEITATGGPVRESMFRFLKQPIPKRRPYQIGTEARVLTGSPRKVYKRITKFFPGKMR